MTSIALCSGKGGVGKTTIALNLGLLLAGAGKKVVVVDSDLAMSSLGLMMGIERVPITLQNVLMNENPIDDAVYNGPNNLRYVPASLSLERFARVDFGKLRAAVRQLESLYDYVLIDCPPGMGPDAQASLQAATHAIIILVPEPSSLAAALKIKTVLDRASVRFIGAVTNMNRGDPSEIKKKEVEAILGLKVIQELPEDVEVRRSSALQQPAMIRNPASPFSLGIYELGMKITGEALPKPKGKVSTGLLGNFFTKKP